MGRGFLRQGKRADGPMSADRTPGGAPASPAVISSANYTQGDPLGGGQSIVLTGTGFTGATGVYFGETASGSVVVNGPTQITCSLPAHASGTVDITVVGPGGTSNGLSFLYWTPSEETSCTLLLESPDYNGTAWTARKDAKVGNTWVKVNAGLTAVPASSGAPAPAGAGGNDGAGDGTCGLKGSTATWDDYLGTTASTRKPGSVVEVASSTSTQQLNTAGTPYNGPASICTQTTGVFGINHGNQGSGGGSKATMVYTYDGTDFNIMECVHNSTALQCTITRADAVASGGTHDISINGTLSGGSATLYQSTSGNGYSTAFGALNVLLFQKLDDTAATGQDFAGVAKAYAIYNVKITDSVLTKTYQWSRQRHGVA